MSGRVSVAAAMTPLSPKTTGIVLMVITMACFSVMDVCAKLLSQRVDVVQAIWARYAGQALVVIVYLLPRIRSVARTDKIKLHIARSTCLLCATCCFFTALSLMPIASATAVMNIAPVLMTLGGALFLGEKIGPRRLGAVAAAFVGAIIVIRPGSETFSAYALLPLAGAVFYSGYALFTRHLGQSESVWTSLFYTALVGAIVLSMAVPFRWQTPDATAIALMIAIACAGTIGQIFLIRAFMVAEAGTIAPFSYSAILFAVIWGITIFGETPATLTYLGALVIVAAGLYVWHVENRGDRQVAQSR